VWLELRDGGGRASGPVCVPAGPGAFARGGADAFELSLPAGLCAPAALAVWREGGGTGWLLDRVEVALRRGHGGGGGGEEEVTVFPCGLWLAPASPRAELAPAPRAATAWYRAVVATADAKGAGTDAGVTLQLVGQRQPPPPGAAAQGGAFPAAPRTRPHLLDRAGALERGGRDAFEFSDADAGPLTAARLASDGRGPRGAWCVASVTVQRLAGPGGAVESETHFPAGGDRWLDEACGLVVELAAAPAPAPPLEYTLRVRTGAARGAGTDASVSVQLAGDRGDTAWARLPARPGQLERGTVGAPGCGALRGATGFVAQEVLTCLCQPGSLCLHAPTRPPWLPHPRRTCSRCACRTSARCAPCACAPTARACPRAGCWTGWR
jgi:hypothetical protein